MGAFSGRMDAGIGRRCEEFLCVGGGRRSRDSWCGMDRGLGGVLVEG
jgi:hypothetical protein